jgi:hypothetical protein
MHLKYHICDDTKVVTVCALFLLPLLDGYFLHDMVTHNAKRTISNVELCQLASNI